MLRIIKRSRKNFHSLNVKILKHQKLIDLVINIEYNHWDKVKLNLPADDEVVNGGDDGRNVDDCGCNGDAVQKDA